jgi:hypothetical protein
VVDEAERDFDSPSRVKRAAVLSHQLIDPGSLSRRKRCQDGRLGGRAGVNGGVAVRLHVR